MNTTPEFAELYGAFTGDGWMSRGNTGITMWITGNPKDEKEYYLGRIKELFKKSLDFDVFPRDFLYWGTYGVMIGQRKIIEKFIAAGAPIGKKARIAKVPDFVLSNSELFIPFARGLFDTDGCINFQKSYNKSSVLWKKTHRHRPRVFFTTVSPELALGLKAGLQRIGFCFRLTIGKPRKRNPVPSYKVELYGKKNTKAFFAILEPRSPKHLAKFEQWLKQGFYALP
ncbi:MAG: hypothetical protein J4215_03710 [Candidatus Diapherotrites archaeon]|uniref:DOD-type homing endonuclease domain-containing protein n=1 Tax=Candidatus Iainarchaeum sp. TaxID=3101447 RepID=A0A8T4L300_9ARCH|nr:hypothetical protein [Candidatus Diapherotrites archaeon]